MFLVSRLGMERPLAEFNVLEQLIEGQPEQLAPTLTKLLCNISPVRKPNYCELQYIQTARVSMQQGRLSIGATDMVIPTGWVA